jgi:hypothetical protein
MAMKIQAYIARSMMIIWNYISKDAGAHILHNFLSFLIRTQFIYNFMKHFSMDDFNYFILLTSLVVK